MAKTILVVEDDADMREWLSLYLRNAVTPYVPPPTGIKPRRLA